MEDTTDYEAPEIRMIGSVEEITQGNIPGRIQDAQFPNHTQTS